MLCRHRLPKKRALPKEKEEKRSLKGAEKEQKAKGGGKGEKEKQEGPDRAGAREIPSVISQRNAISGR